MSAVILQFPFGRRDRAKPATERKGFDPSAPFGPEFGFAPATLEGKVRAIGFKHGLNTFDRASLVMSAKRWLQCGISEESILVRAETSAKRTAASKPQGPDCA